MLTGTPSWDSGTPKLRTPIAALTPETTPRTPRTPRGTPQFQLELHELQAELRSSNLELQAELRRSNLELHELQAELRSSNLELNELQSELRSSLLTTPQKSRLKMLHSEMLHEPMHLEKEHYRLASICENRLLHRMTIFE